MQVIFKSCKLIPVLIGSILIQKKKHKPMDFIAAAAMCVGLIFFTLADSKVSPKFSSYGVAIISLALVFDAVIGNVQELAMKKHKASNSEVVFYSYGIGFLYLFVFMLLTGYFQEGFNFGLKVSYEHKIDFYSNIFCSIQKRHTAMASSSALLAI
jgi:adenosine 3'-phospho 5'-phosphosulfate transporter B3